MAATWHTRPATQLFVDAFVILHYQKKKGRMMIVPICACYYLELRNVKLFNIGLFN